MWNEHDDEFDDAEEVNMFIPFPKKKKSVKYRGKQNKVPRSLRNEALLITLKMKELSKE